MGSMALDIIHISYTPTYRLRLSDGTCVFMDWHKYLGPEFFHDKNTQRPIDEWWENDLINDQLDWFIKRGEKA